MRPLFFMIFLATFLLLFGCLEQKTGGAIVASNPVLGSIAYEVIGNKSNITVIAPESADPHGFGPSAKDIALAESSKLFIYNGLVEKWATNIEAKNKLDVSKEVSLLKIGYSYDPHFWLSLNNAKEIGLAIYNKAIELDPENKEYYYTRYILFIKGISRTDGYAKYRLANCKTIVLSHPFLNYFAKDYGLSIVAINNLDSSDTSAKHIKEVIDFMKENNIHTIFISSLEPEDKFKDIAKQANAKIIKLQVMSNDYFSMMKYNIDTIADNCN